MKVVNHGVSAALPKNPPSPCLRLNPETTVSVARYLLRPVPDLNTYAHNSLFVAYRIRAYLLARDYNDLIAMPPPVGNTPHTGSIRRPRVAV